MGAATERSPLGAHARPLRLYTMLSARAALYTFKRLPRQRGKAGMRLPVLTAAWLGWTQGYPSFLVRQPRKDNAGGTHLRSQQWNPSLLKSPSHLPVASPAGPSSALLRPGTKSAASFCTRVLAERLFSLFFDSDQWHNKCWQATAWTKNVQLFQNIDRCSSWKANTSWHGMRQRTSQIYRKYRTMYGVMEKTSQKQGGQNVDLKLNLMQSSANRIS